MSPRPNKTQYAVLGMLSLGLSTGYDMKAFVEGSLNHFWSESYGQLYPMLRRLVAEGLATVRAEPQEGKPDRKLYALTDAGHSALAAWLSEPVEPQTTRNELLLKLFFGKRASREVCERHVQDSRRRLVDTLGTYGEIERNLREEAADHAELPYWLMTLSFGQHQTRALIDWCDETLEQLEKLPDAGEEGDDATVCDG